MLSGRAGSTYFELMIKFIIVITLMATVLSFLSIFTVYLNLNHMCGRIVRAIELEGQISDNVYDVFYRLKEQTGISPPVQISIPMEVRITGMSEKYWKLLE